MTSDKMSLRRGWLGSVGNGFRQEITEIQKMIERFSFSSKKLAKSFPVKTSIGAGNKELLELSCDKITDNRILRSFVA